MRAGCEERGVERCEERFVLVMKLWFQNPVLKLSLILSQIAKGNFPHILSIWTPIQRESGS